MIKNERQYRITKDQLHRFKGAFLELRKRNGSAKISDMIKIREEALRSQINELRTEIEQYENSLVAEDYRS